MGYTLKRVEIVNFTGQDLEDIEVWVNRRYVCYVPKMQDRQLKEIHFPMLYDEQGKTFHIDKDNVRVEKVELFKDGKLYEIVCHSADF